ncbi:divergent polysaccharide deacetylase family protein [Falsihalocynthiibacter sp. SS001]|uniref:divergent polysaccharide deacetylase family protein n=1 Tax=Falsihalocynthiibacter sp. SS001 TaxID=3349698 RepID=UPI0036D3B6DF
MLGLIKGAILGIACALIVISLMVIFGPKPETGDVSQTDAAQEVVVESASPDAPQASEEETTEAGTSTDSQVEMSDKPADQPESTQEAPVPTQETAPVEADKDITQPPAPEADVPALEIAPQDDAQDLQIEMPQIQSNAEAEDAPPVGQFESPGAPRASIKREVDSSTFGNKVGNLIDQEAQTARATVRTDRLPSIGDDGNEEIVQNIPNALRDNAVSFAASGQPLISILVLEGIDRTHDAARLEILTDTGFPVSVGVNPSTEGAAERAEAYRNIGADVVILSDIPAQAAPQDVEVTLGAYFSILPDAVAVMEVPAGSGEGNRVRLGRNLLQHIVAVMEAEGLGLIAEQKGLNSSVQLANRAGVPNVQVFHDITAEDAQNGLRTIFNRAVFRATQTGASVVTIPGDAESLSALQAWALADRPPSVQIAPISAVLRGVASQ